MLLISSLVLISERKEGPMISFSAELKFERYALSFQEPPFVQLKGPKSLDVSHPVFEGFCIDILVEMSKLLGFSYNITLVSKHT